MKFHINEAGEPGACSAKKRCPFGGEDEHYTSPEAARKAYEQQQSESLTSHSKKSQLTVSQQQLIDELVALHSDPARSRYGFPEDELIRHNIAVGIRERTEKLANELEFGELYILSKVDNGERRKAMDELAMTVANDPRFSFRALMGRRHDIPKNRMDYANKLRAAVEADPILRKQAEALAEEMRKKRAWGRAFEQQVPIPETYANAFEELWSAGETVPGSKVSLEKKLQELESKGDALSNEDKHALREVREAIAARGRSFFPNVEKVEQKANAEGWAFDRMY